MQGLAFVGAAGQLLTKMIAAMGMTREEVYSAILSSAVRRRIARPSPRRLRPACPICASRWRWVRPQVIVLLGATAAKTLLRPDFRITREHGSGRNARACGSCLPTTLPRYCAMKAKNATPGMICSW